MSGIFRSIAALVIVVLAVLAVLVVFDIIPRDVLGEYAARTLLVACILAITAAAVGFLFRTGGKR
jgi:hypothetical protein